MLKTPVGPVLAFAFVLCCSACSDAGSDGTPRPAFETSIDSAGATVVESASPGWQPDEGWTVDSLPALDLTETGDGPMHEFYRVWDATRLADGRILVADGGSSEVRAYSSDGRFLWASGGEGEGPGEFQRLSRVSALRGDSILAFDGWVGRATIFDADGELGRTAGPYDTDVRIRDVFVVDDSLLASAVYDRVAMGERPSGLYRMTNYLLRLSATTLEPIDTVTTYPGNQGYMFALGDMSPLFWKTGHLAARDGRMVVGSADAMEYRVYGASGSLERIVRVPDYDLALSAAEVDAEIDARQGPNTRPEIREALSQMPRPSTRPAYQQLAIDAAGNVWAAEYHSATDGAIPVDWEVFSPAGQWLGSVRTPPRFRVFEIGADYVLGRHLTDLDVERVLLLQLDRAGANSGGAD